jgi:hypothetical protein
MYVVLYVVPVVAKLLILFSGDFFSRILFQAQPAAAVPAAGSWGLPLQRMLRLYGCTSTAVQLTSRLSCSKHS